MRKLLTCFIFLVLSSHSQLLMAQNKFNLEFYGGPQRSYNHVVFTPAQPGIDVKAPWNYNLGINFLTRLKQNLQLSVQAEYARNNQKTINYPNYPDMSSSFQRQISTESFGNYSVGLRYNWEKENHGFFLQPSIGITVNKFFDLISTDSITQVSYENKTEIIPNLRLEAGYKYYTNRKNYFMVGIRHQLGLQNLNPLSFYRGQSAYSTEISRSGSYTSMFVGYGINLDNWSKSKRQEYKKNKAKESKEIKRDRAWSSGAYLVGSGFLRFRPKSEREPNLGFSHISSGSLFGAGYRLNSLSVETGYATFSYANSISIPQLNTRVVLNSSSIHAIPLTLKYDFLIGDKNRLRIGSSFSTYLITGSGNDFGREGGFGGPDFNLSYVAQNSDLNGKVFFNAGVYAELPIFNSSLINFKVSQNFGSPKVGTVDLTGQIKGDPVGFKSSGTLNGFMLEMGYKLPLNLIFKKGQK